MASIATRRAAPRCRVPTYLPLWQSTGEKWGNIINLSLSGCLVLVAAPVPLHERRLCHLRLPTEQGFSVELGDESDSFMQLQLDTIWQQKDVNPRLHTVGCSIESVQSPEALEQLLEWLVQMESR